MTYVTSKEMLIDAYENKYAVGAFATHNLEVMKAVIEAADELASPVIFQTTPSTIKYLGADFLVAMTKVAAEKYKVPVALHLDHGDSISTVIQCIRAGFTSIMIDGSHLPFEKNVQLVKQVVDIAHTVNVPVEAELGTIGGVEDDLTVNEEQALFTDPDLAAEFVQRTGIDFFAPAFGTAHGEYKGEPKLDFNRLELISQNVNVPLVMHGASGVPEQSIVKSLNYGISKINISTELKIPFAEELRTYLINHPDEYDPRKYFLSARESVKQVVKDKITMFKQRSEIKSL
jgi:tagatose 1,6-diphosphate aldolase GatY/KbaY